MLLLFENIVVGEITNDFEHQGTQFGDFECVLPADGDQSAKRLRAFIEFCQDWFERSGSPDGADASDFDQFRDVVYSGKWSVEKQAGSRCKIQDAPMFSGGLNGDVSWLEEDGLTNG